MLIIDGWQSWLALGLAGGLIAELIRLAPLFINRSHPRGTEWLGTAIYVVLGAGALFYGTGERVALEVATLGAAFPLLFASGARAFLGGDGDDGSGGGGPGGGGPDDGESGDDLGRTYVAARAHVADLEVPPWTRFTMYMASRFFL